jgi:acyl carrier protein
MAAYGNGAGRGEVLEHVIRVLEEITDDWDVGQISADSRLSALNLESINLVYFIAEIQQSYGLENRLVAQIRSFGRPLGDLRVADIADFVHAIRDGQDIRREAPRHE